MCGIAGLVDLHHRLSPEAAREIVTRMTRTLRHRGPDDEGVWQSADRICTFGQRRLSIIDTSGGGHQPMISPDGNALTFNGEIYNYQDLKRDFTAQGARFTTASDTEVLLYGLDRLGADLLPRLDAMYAFGHYTPRTRELLLARDNFGEKPLYYTFQNGLFAFASELQALTLLPDFDARIPLDRIGLYLALQYVPAPLSIYESVGKVPPGHYLKLTSDGQVTLARHFAFRPDGPVGATRSLDELADELDEILTDSCRTRLISDVPLGAFLSGGVDSTTVVATIRRKLGLPLKTFSIGFEGAPDSEHVQAAEMAAHLGTDHYQEIIGLQTAPMGLQIAQILDEPNGDSGCLPSFALSRMTRQHVTVAVSGDGGDELFGGYGRYFHTLQDEINAKARGDATWRAGTAYYSPRLMILRDENLEKFMGEIPAGTAAWLAAHRAFLNDDPRPLLHRLRQEDAENYMHNAVLAKVDRMSMQHALEVRAPILGRRVADFAMKLGAADCVAPDPLRRSGDPYTDLHGKLVLKQLAARYIPRDWLDRPKKGFGLPLQNWDAPALVEATTAILLSPHGKLQSWVPRANLERFCAFHAQTPVIYHLWNAFILENWLRHHPANVA